MISGRIRWESRSSCIASLASIPPSYPDLETPHNIGGMPSSRLVERVITNRAIKSACLDPRNALRSGAGGFRVNLPSQPVALACFIDARKLGSVILRQTEEGQYLVIRSRRRGHKIVVQDQLDLFLWEYREQTLSLGTKSSQICILQ